MENTKDEIIWKCVKSNGEFDCCARVGYSFYTEDIGTYGDKKFARFRVWEAYKGYNKIEYKITHQTIIPL